jgi:hypothetical protein
MPRRRIDRFVNEALVSLGDWLKTNEWYGKERDCVNLFAHKFLFEKIEPGAAIEDATQISIECPLKQPEKYPNRVASKDLVIWPGPLQTTWSRTYESVHSPKAVMEWKVFRDQLPKAVFDSHDEEWVTLFTSEQAGSFGFIVSVDLASDDPAVYWRMSKGGQFGKVRQA